MPETEKPVVEPVSMPKINIDKRKLAITNAWSMALAMFLGYSAIFCAIAGFTKGKWLFSIPFFGRFMGSNSAVPTIIMAGLFALAFAIYGILTLKKVTDAEATKKAWGCIANVFLGFVAVYALNMVGIIIYSLMSLGRKGFEQGDLWLSSFLPTVICAIGAGTISFIAGRIAKGQTSLLRIVCFIAIAIATIGFIIVFVQQLVSYYGKTSSNSVYDDYRSYSDILDGLLK